MGVQYQPHRHFRRDMAGSFHAETMGEVDMVHGGKRGLHVALARRVDAIEMAEPHRAPRLVEGRD